MKDLNLNLNPKKVPLLAGEVVNADQGGVCASMNSIIATLPQAIPNSYVISSMGCTDSHDNLHFNAEGYRMLGSRYAEKMLTLMGYKNIKPAPGMSQKPEPVKVGEGYVKTAGVTSIAELCKEKPGQNEPTSTKRRFNYKNIIL